MPWNWELPEWPNFQCDLEAISALDKQFLLEAGRSLAFLKNISQDEQSQFMVEMLSTEGLESAKIEGEILDRKSLQSSIKKHFGLQTSSGRENPKEAGMARLVCHAYRSF